MTCAVILFRASEVDQSRGFAASIEKIYEMSEQDADAFPALDVEVFELELGFIEGTALRDADHVNGTGGNRDSHQRSSGLSDEKLQRLLWSHLHSCSPQLSLGEHRQFVLQVQCDRCHRQWSK